MQESKEGGLKNFTLLIAVIVNFPNTPLIVTSLWVAD